MKRNRLSFSEEEEDLPVAKTFDLNCNYTEFSPVPTLLQPPLLHYSSPTSPPSPASPAYPMSTRSLLTSLLAKNPSHVTPSSTHQQLSALTPLSPLSLSLSLETDSRTSTFRENPWPPIGCPLEESPAEIDNGGTSQKFPCLEKFSAEKFPSEILSLESPYFGGPSASGCQHSTLESSKGSSEGNDGGQRALTLSDIASLPLEEGASILRRQPWTAHNLKNELRGMLGSPEKKDAFLGLQKMLRANLSKSSPSPSDSQNLSHGHNLPHSRDSLNPHRPSHTCSSVHPLHSATIPKAYIEILVTLKTGIQACLHPDISILPSALADIFLQKRCRNFTCQSKLPAGDCRCDICSFSESGFCNLCMCMVCCKFDFDANTCHWIGCDFCLHWCHTGCALRMGYIATGPAPLLPRSGILAVSGGLSEASEGMSEDSVGKSGALDGGGEAQFRCVACSRSSELYGFVRDVTRLCGAGWERDVVCRELDLISRMFQGARDERGKMLLSKAKSLLDEVTRNSVDCATAMEDLQQFFTREYGELG